MKVEIALVLAALASAIHAGVAVDDRLPGGNVVVESVAGDVVRVRPDMRDTEGGWFYWAFRVTGAEGRTVKFSFGENWFVGSRGPAVSFDRGKTWEWGDLLQPAPAEEATGDHADASGFTWAFRAEDCEVWFAQTMPYSLDDWRAFLSRHAAQEGKAFVTNELCRTRKGRGVPFARFGNLSDDAPYRIVLTARHHCEEASASFVLEGLLETVLAPSELGVWLRREVEFRVVPFVDFDGMTDGDQGKNRKPHDHCRDYNAKPIYPEVRAVMSGLRAWRPDVAIDVHSPWLRGSWLKKDNSNEFVYQVGLRQPYRAAQQRRFGGILEKVQTGGLGYRRADDYAYGRAWNSDANYAKGRTLVQWASAEFPESALTTTFEIPFANARRKTLQPDDLRTFGRDLAMALRVYLEETKGLPDCVDGVYPRLAMFNAQGECGTGAVVPWAGSLWAVTYGPHCPMGGSDKLYQITPDLRQIVRAESVGGTPADRLIHRETNQLLIGPYVIDAQGGVRVVPPKKMPGRLTGAARHLTDPAKLVYVATMDNGLYELDMKTLAVKTVFRDHNWVDGKIWGQDALGKPPLPDWNEAKDNVLPGSHTKGMCSGFGRIQLANNGEYHPEAKTNPWIPAGVLGDCAGDGSDQRVIRRCQFTDITTRDGIRGNEHPDENPIWALGWDAKSVLLAVTTNGVAWTHYRLPKASHCYDGAHGWNTEWPRIRDVGFGDGTYLGTMHGTFWKIPEGFSPAQPNGIRPISTYLKVIGDFCRWGENIVFGCDDQAMNEFLGSRTLKKDAPKRDQSQSNLWFVKPDDLSEFGPPSGEGWVWCREDVKKGAVSDPFLYAGYETMDFSFTDADGKPVPHELLRDGDWVRVQALADVKGANAHFVFGPARPATLPRYDGFVEFYDDHSKKTYRFPNVNGDKTVICREVATERDLLYAGGVFYELPADNAGGFAELRPIALADEPVRSIEARLGLVFINGKPMALDRLWKNGTAAEAYWLWRSVKK